MTEVTAKVELKPCPNQRHRSEHGSYIMGLRDLAAMPHVSLDVGNVIRDAADLIERLDERDLRPDDALRSKLEAAIKTTQYKYFGDYEFSQDQTDAVETLVDFARAALNERNPDHD